MPTAFSEILTWVNDLEYWEKAAFDLLLSKNEITDADVNRLCDYLLQDKDVEPVVGDRSDLKLEEYLSSDDDCLAFELVQISNLQNINALVPDQSLEFGKSLTAIFGSNGSGKSGYARVLGSAGFTRGDEDIIRDITKPFDPDSPQMVDIALRCEDEDVTIQHQIGTHCRELSSFYVFDSTSVNVHLTQENTMSFSPTSLQYLQHLATLTDRVRAQLKERIQEKEKPNAFVAAYAAESEIRGYVESLSHETDIGGLEQLANVTPEVEEARKALQKKIATIETQGVSAKLKDLQKEISDLDVLHSRIKQAIDQTNKQNIEEVNKQIKEHRRIVEAANQLGLDKFKEGTVQSVGSEEWHTFLHSSKDLAQKEVSDGEYPVEDSFCLLCQQPLSEEARNLISQLWGYLDSEVQKRLQVSEETLANWRKDFSKIDVSFIDEELAVARLLLDRVPELHASVQAFKDTLTQSKQTIISRIDELKDIDPADEDTEILVEVKALIKTIEKKKDDWEKETGEVDKMQSQALVIEHRKVLGTQIKKVKEYHQDLVWIHGASSIKSNTSHITRKYNQLFSALVSDEYVAQFESTLTSLGRPMKVSIQTRGKKSEVYKQLILEADETTPDNYKNPDKILSEGEKRAVALADFLTEIQLDPNSSGIILDDPVTSLDMAWRRNIASALVDFAETRQVIVFTHDMPFLSFLNEIASEVEIPIDNHWIKRGDLDDCPGHIFTNNSPALESVYKDAEKAEDYYRKAKKSGPENQLDMIRAGFGALRTSYEVLTINNLFQGVVKRFDERTHVMNLASIAWDESLVEEITEKFGVCSRHMEGHSHSDAYFDKIPDLKLFRAELDVYHRIKKDLKTLQNKK